MKQTSVQFSFDEEKLNAVKMYLAEKGETLEQELESYMDVLFKKNVPANVRDYIELRGSNTKVKPSEKK